MLGKTAGGLFWMFRYLERSENTARMIDAGLHIALTHYAAAEDEWSSILSTARVRDAYLNQYERFEGSKVIDFLLRDRTNPSSVLSVIEAARNNARMVRTALTREVWGATNECWMTLKDILARPVQDQELTAVLNTIRRQSALVRGALASTMLRNDIYNFTQLGTFLERADNTARILDVKYYVLLPNVMQIGSSIDNVQWETILRSVSAQRAYRWLNGNEVTAIGIAEFLVLDRRMPRSLAFCYAKIVDNLDYLADDYGAHHRSQVQSQAVRARIHDQSIESIFDHGLHEFIETFIRDNNALGIQIEEDYRFYE